MKYYIIILEETIKSFSCIGHGEKCAVTMMLKGNREPLAGIDAGDKVAGYIAGSVRTFSYLFRIGVDRGTGRPYFEKTYESKGGARIESLPPAIRELVEAVEQTEAFLEISEAQYRQITAGMWKALGACGLFPVAPGSGPVSIAGSGAGAVAPGGVPASVAGSGAGAVAPGGMPAGGRLMKAPD